MQKKIFALSLIGLLSTNMCMAQEQTQMPMNSENNRVSQEDKPDLNNPVTRSMFTLVKFIDTYGIMSGSSKVCKPSEQIYIETCVAVALSHWKEITGVDLSKVKITDDNTPFKEIVKKEFSDQENKGYNYMLNHTEECHSFISTEVHSPIWFFCGRQNLSFDPDPDSVLTDGLKRKKENDNYNLQ